MASRFQIRFNIFKTFAEDSTLSCKINRSNNTEVSFELTSELKNVNSWLDSNKFLVDDSKSTFKNYSYCKNFQLPQINLGNDFISEVDQTNFLGVILDKPLTFHEQLKNNYLARMVPRLTYGI